MSSDTLHIVRLKTVKALSLITALIACLSFGAGAQPPSTANQLKAVFLYNFTQFVDWPAASMSNNNFVIGILGTDPFGSYIESVVAGEKVQGRSIAVHRYKDVDEIKNCHILFINKSNWDESIQDLGNRSILTVGDATEFAAKGGMVRFFFENNKIRLQINLDAVRKADLSVSSKLLRVADVINQQ